MFIFQYFVEWVIAFSQKPLQSKSLKIENDLTLLYKLFFDSLHYAGVEYLSSWFSLFR